MSSRMITPAELKEMWDKADKWTPLDMPDVFQFQAYTDSLIQIARCAYRLGFTGGTEAVVDHLLQEKGDR